MRAAARCPWGEIQHSKTYGPGIDYVGTAGHGGFLISDERLAEMPAKYRATAFLKSHPHAFEEDSAWCGVVLSWPEYFTVDTVRNAGDVFQRYYANRNG